MESPPMADYFESYLSFGPHVLVRFGRWREATQLELPDDPDLYCTKAAHVHYARAIGHAALGEVDAALAEEALYHAAIERVPESRTLHNNKVVDLLAVGSEMVRGEILYRQAKYDEAYAALRRAIAFEDNLPMTSLGAGCSRSVMHLARCCWNRVTRTRPRRCSARILALAVNLHVQQCTQITSGR